MRALVVTPGTPNRTLDIACAVVGVLALGLGLLTVLSFPLTAELPAGFRTPIIAFEFAAAESDLSYLAGDGAVETANRAKMEAGMRWDMAFPFAYAGFLLLLLLQLAQEGQRLALIGIPFAVLIVPLDINENISLLRIVEALGAGEMAGQLLPDLSRATWLKWGAIAVAIAVLALGLVRRGAYFSAALSGTAALVIVMCWISGSNPLIAETMSLMLSLFFLVFGVKACLKLRVG